MLDKPAIRTDPGILPVLLTKGDRKAYYNRLAPFYDFLTERSERGTRKAGLAMLAAAPGEHLLEIGFGTGRTLIELAEAAGPDGKVYGIDLSEQMVARAHRLLNERNLQSRAELQRGDAECLPYADNTFDGIFMSFTLELFDIPEIPAVLSECKRVLKPGGRLVVVSMSREEPLARLTRVLEWIHRRFPHLLDCRPIHVRRSLEAADFAIEHVTRDRMWVPVEIVRAVKHVA